MKVFLQQKFFFCLRPNPEHSSKAFFMLFRVSKSQIKRVGLKESETERERQKEMKGERERWKERDWEREVKIK